jgi:hypothetical protein
MLPKNTNALIYGVARVIDFEPSHPHSPTQLSGWTHWLSKSTGQDNEQVGRVHRKQSALRRIPRRSNGNSLPLIGLRPAMKLKPQCVRSGGSPW